MNLLASGIFRLVVLICAVALPGLALARLVGLRTRRGVDAFLSVTAGGIAAISVVGSLLLACGLYFRAALLVMTFVLPAACVWWTGKQGIGILKLDKAGASATSAFSVLDRAVVGIVGLWLLAALIDSLTSPLTSWDAVVSWDKWASDWARRTDSWRYPTGLYPQTLPILGSVLYKLFGTAQQVFPPEHFAWHGAQPVLAAAAFVALSRLAHLMGAPVWAAVSLSACSSTLMAQVGAGTADVLLLFAVLAPVALLAALNEGELEISRCRGLYWGVLLFAAAFTKLTGLLVLPLAVAVALRKRRNWLPKELILMVALPVLLVSAFLAYQRFAQSIPVEQRDPTGLYFSSTLEPNRFDTDIKRSYASDGGVSLEATLNRLANDYGVSPQAALICVWPLAACILAALKAPTSRVLVVWALCAFGVWYKFASYDLRNLLPSICFLGLAAASGGAYLCRKAASNAATRWLMSGILGLCGIIFATQYSSTLGTYSNLFGGVRPGSAPGKRIEAVEGGPLTTVTQFFPPYGQIYKVLATLPLLEPPAKLATNTALCRWFPNAIYTASDWSYAWVNAGDVYLGAFGLTPPAYDQWTLIISDTTFSCWVNQKQAHQVVLDELLLTGSAPPKKLDGDSSHLAVMAGGTEALIMYNLAERDIRKGDTLVWQAVIRTAVPDPQLTPTHLVYDESLLAPGRNFEVRDDRTRETQRISYGGLLTFDGSVSSEARDGILVGLRRTGPPGLVVVEKFRISLFRRGRLKLVRQR